MEGNDGGNNEGRRREMIMMGVGTKIFIQLLIKILL
jgi:hypothetical protein